MAEVEEEAPSKGGGQGYFNGSGCFAHRGRVG